MANFCSECGIATKSSALPMRPVKKSKKPKRSPSRYNIKFSKAFKKVAPRFKKKGGGWKKDGFKRAGAAARKAIK